MLLYSSRHTNRSASSSRIADYPQMGPELFPISEPTANGPKMALQQLVRRSSIMQPCNHSSFRSAKGRVQRKASTTCVPEIQIPKEQHRRVTVLGAGSTGKSAIITQFLYERFPNRYKKTVDELHRAEYEISGQNLTLEILDTSGYSEFPAMRELAIKKSDAFILVFSVDNEGSLEELKEIREEIIRVKNEQRRAAQQSEPLKIPMVVVANKAELEDNKWKVDRTYVECLVKCDWDSCGYVEASAKTSVGIVEIFKELLVQANVRYALSPAIKKRRESMPNVFAGIPARNSSPENDQEYSSQVSATPSRMGSASSSRRGSVIGLGKRDSCAIS
ncbi:ras-related protein Rap-1b-like [Paramacrobiotus metropolitanus]|uniref:ras-related protein Rap-1b-like n=1 Tax=Paramacrobiotus metropolitanus TaxID=2943436 RepID=UPI002445D00C|nr:ras-related protein Rap-1b-like [Paramacrobiotus metropolitanus]